MNLNQNPKIEIEMKNNLCTHSNALLARIPITAGSSITSTRLAGISKIFPINVHIKPVKGHIHANNSERGLVRMIDINFNKVFVRSQIPPSLNGAALEKSVSLIRSGSGPSGNGNSGGVRLNNDGLDIMDRDGGSMVSINDTSDNLLTIDNACNGNNRWFLNTGSTGTRRGGLVSVRGRRNEGVANRNVAIMKPLGEDSPFWLFVITVVVTGCSVARNGESRGAFLFPGDYINRTCQTNGLAYNDR